MSMLEINDIVAPDISRDISKRLDSIIIRRYIYYYVHAFLTIHVFYLYHDHYRYSYTYVSWIYIKYIVFIPYIEA